MRLAKQGTLLIEDISTGTNRVIAASPLMNCSIFNLGSATATRSKDWQLDLPRIGFRDAAGIFSLIVKDSPLAPVHRMTARVGQKIQAMEQSMDENLEPNCHGAQTNGRS